jgi:hypothetical protein
MNKAISDAILASGVVLLIFGNDAYNSSVSDIILNIVKDRGIARKIGRRTFANDR